MNRTINDLIWRWRRRSETTDRSTLRKLLLRVLMVCMAMIGAAAFGQTVTVTPSGYITVALGGQIQFTATVTGSTNHNVTWSLPQQKQNSTALGTISSTGLYTAPLTVPPNAVEIEATSQANSNATGTQYVYVLPAGPQLTSGTPNPLSPGTSTVTLNGNGFVSGAEVDYTINGATAQTNPLTLSSTKLTASIYVPPTAANVAFTVTNPGTSPSNSLVIPVNQGAPHYTLTVTKGSGSGSYAAGTVVTITANTPPSGQIFADWTGSTVANPNAATTTITMPAAAAAVTANYTNSNNKYNLTVVNGSGTGAYTAGTVVTITANNPPSGDVFQDWTGATVANPNNASTTLTMPAATTTVTANYQPAAQVPYPVASHPRLWITPTDLPKLQGWATSSNKVWTYFNNLVGQCASEYTTSFFPNGVANPNYPDFGDTQGYTGLITEDVAVVLAFDSMIDPNPKNRITYAQYARNLLMYAMNQAALGVQAGAPFRDPAFATYNRASECGQEWPLIVDWIYNAKDANGHAILSATDKATIRKVFLIWCGENLVASTTGGDSPPEVGVMNSLALINNGAAPYRMASNNYYLAHNRFLTMMGLCIDPSDDPVLNSAKAPAALGNTLRSYILDGIGAWLYQIYAMMGDPATVAADYGLTNKGVGFGLASGGLPPEGMLYGESFGYLLEDLLALQTSGFNSTALSGPQIKLANAPVWDRFVTGFISSLTPTSSVPPSETYLGPVYQMSSYGDLLRLYITPNDMQPFALLALLEQEQGQSTHVNEARWFDTNVVPNSLSYNVEQPWTWGVTQSILYYLLMDPTAAAPADPRPNYPLNFFDPAAGRVVAHSDWTTEGTSFAYRASWESINHQDGDAGSFELFRKGEWLTKEMSNYDNNLVGFTPYYLNSLDLKNWSASGTPNFGWNEVGIWKNGGQWMWASSAGDPSTVNSFGPGYSYVSSDLTNLYNFPDVWEPAEGAADITQATRSVVWLNNDYVVIYDRATSIHSGLFKTFNMSMATAPTINGNVATEIMPDGQQLFVHALLPENAVLTQRYAAGDLSPHAELDPMFYVFSDQDPTLPTDTRFLHVLQGADAGAAMVPATYASSSSGTAFDGAVFGTMAVFFPHNAGVTVASTTFTLPSSVTTLVVTGLKPGASYGLTTTTTATGLSVTLNPSGTGYVADSAGVLKAGI